MVSSVHGTLVEKTFIYMVFKYVGRVILTIMGKICENMADFFELILLLNNSTQRGILKSYF